MTKLSVVENLPPLLGDISAMLRQLADEIDAGEHGDWAHVVAVTSGETIDVRGFGKVNGLDAIATLNLGLAQLVNGTLKAMDE